MFSKPLLLKVSISNSTTTITRTYVLQATVIKLSGYNSTTTITRMYVLKATNMKVSVYNSATTISCECMFSRPLLLKVSVYNSTSTITRMYVLRNTVIIRVSLQQCYYYHTNVFSKGHCCQKCQFTTVIQLLHKCMF